MKNAEHLLPEIKSIRTRLTLFYTLAAFFLLASVTLFLYWITITILYKADYEFLADEIQTIQYIFYDISLDEARLKQAVVGPLQSNGSIYRYYTRIFDENKKILIETPNMEKILPAQQYANKHSKLLGKKRYFWYAHKNNNYLLVQAPIELGSHDKVGLIQIALDISYQHTIISDRRNILYLLLFGTIFALMIGFFVAHRGMRSLYVLTKTVEKITVSSLNHRIDPKSWPKELWGLSVAFNQMLDRIEASFIRLKQFSADLSHELRTPINNLIGETEITLSYAHSVPEFKQVMESNLEELQRISSLIENILFLARAENPRLDLQKERLKAHKEIELICDYYQAMALEKNIQVYISGEAELAANPVMFRRMISNILSNSLKYTPTAGKVNFNVEEKAGGVQITLSDTGIGIAPEHLPNIFQRFYRTDAARSQHLGGMGLGLAIVKSIVDVHHGQINLSSIPNVGTTVTITL